VFKDLLNKIGEDLVENLKRNIKEVNYNGFGPANNTGRLANSINYQASEFRLIVKGEDYIYNVSEGRKAGKYPPYSPNDVRYGYKVKGKNKGKPRGTFPNIADWLSTKQSARSRFNYDSKTDSEKAGLVFMVAKGIADRGTVIAQKGGSDLLQSALTNAEKEAALAAINDIFVIEFKSILNGKP
jgi:hypothetical protein